MNLSKDLLDKNSALREADIWNENNDITESKINELFQGMVFNADYLTAREFINNLRNSPYQKLIATKIYQINAQLENIQAIINFDDPQYIAVKLKQSNEKNLLWESDIDFNNIENGRYLKSFSGERYSSFNEDFAHKSDEEKRIMISKNFNAKILKRFSHKMYVMEDCKLHNFNSKFYTASDKNNIYDNANSAILGSITSQSFKKKKTYKHIEKAFVLPFEHTSLNYYHNLTECFFGLRYFDYNKYDFPIIYTKDNFNIISCLSDRLNIDRSRFLSIDEVSDSTIKQAFCFYKGSYTWDKSIYEFSSKLKTKEIEASRRIYLSRSKSKRKIENEDKIESLLKSKGFEIIFAEELTFDEQIDLFSETNFVIAPHGAGLANICFMPHGSKIIEIFQKKMFKSDFYLRSRHNDMKYDFLILDDNDCLALKELESMMLQMGFRDEIDEDEMK